MPMGHLERERGCDPPGHPQETQTRITGMVVGHAAASEGGNNALPSSSRQGNPRAGWKWPGWPGEEAANLLNPENSPEGWWIACSKQEIIPQCLTRKMAEE